MQNTIYRNLSFAAKGRGKNINLYLPVYTFLSPWNNMEVINHCGDL